MRQIESRDFATLNPGYSFPSTAYPAGANESACAIAQASR
jgi:hypothetical protein